MEYMIELVITACMLASPTVCTDHRLAYMEASVTPHQCFLYGQTEMAKWAEAHPKWRITRWKCGVVRRQEAKA